MKAYRALLFALTLLLVFSAVTGVFAEDLSHVGQEVDANQGDYFLYGVAALFVLVLVFLLVFFLIKRRR